jgi:hypothetical protein
MARAALAIVPLWFTTAVLVFGAPLSLKIAVAVMLAVTLASPYHGLLAVAVCVPLASYAGIVLDLGSYRLGEAMTLAFLTGWLIRGDSARQGPHVAASFGWTMAAIVVASMAATAARSSDELHSAVQWAFYGYYLATDPSGWVDGARLLEGVALVAATFATLRRRPQFAVTGPAALTVSLAAAGLTSALLWFRIAPAEVLQRHALIGYRYTAHIADVNAAGSYFVLGVCVALGMSVRASGARRLPWLAGAAMGAIGAWLAASRTANAATLALAAGAVVWWLAADWSRTARWWLAVAATAVVVGAGLFQLRELTRDPEYRGADFRRQFNASSIRMIGAAPVSGIGIGQYKEASTLFLGPAVAYSYGSENAHNYFLQLAAELGIIGFAAFAFWVGAGIIVALRAAATAPRDGRLLGLITGVAAFIATWTTGHPLLLTEVGVPFWIAFGLMWSLADSSMLASDPRPRRRLWTAATAAVVATVGVAAQLTAPDATLRLPESRAITGLYDWETEADGTRYRWTGEYASVFVPSDVTRVYVPVRAPAVAAGVSPMQVEARTAGRPGTRTTVGDGWMIVNLELPEAAPYARFKRVNLHADRTWKPALYRAGSSDMREVGVQVGELTLFRER